MPHDLKYIRTFTKVRPDEEFVQQVVARLPWGHDLMLLDKLPGPETRKWYAAKAIEHHWLRNVLVMQIEVRFARHFPADRDCPQRRTGPQRLIGMGMVEVDSATLMMAIQAVDEVIGRLSEATADEDSADPNDQVALMDYRKAARRLEDAYAKVCEVELDLPPYDELVNYD